MRLLVSADWQARLDNLTRLDQVSAKILELCKKYRLEAVVVAGDLKHNYNPIDTRVIDWWFRFIKRLRAQDVNPMLVLGNHDRIGLYEDDKNWLFILADAGADVYWRAGKWWSPSGGNIFILPFVGTQERLDYELNTLQGYGADPKKDILIFHQTLVGASFNNLGPGSTVDPTKGVPLAKLHPERYRYCLGGDIHLPQEVGKNTWYVGSPFPMDWGEVNQEKVFAVVTDKGLQWIPTGLSGWYDPDLKGFKTPGSWEGTKVRLKVPVNGCLDYSARLATARAEAQLKYPGATVTVLPEVVSNKAYDASDDINDLPEADQVRAYIEQVWPAELVHLKEAAVAHTLYRIRKTGLGIRSDKDIVFKRAWAKNVLCFENIDLSLEQPGLTIITGINRDWNNSSNGSGKTSLLNLLPLALFGRTTKDQTHEDWVREGSTGPNIVGLEWETATGDKVEVERSRNPTAVRLWINGVERSAGGRSTDVGKEIERLCGFSWDMFVSLVYISREEQSFLWGTQKQKQELLNRLQNLERFAVAQKATSSKLTEVRGVLAEWKSELQHLEGIVEEKQKEDNAEAELINLRKRLKETTKLLAGLELPDITTPQKAVSEAERIYQAIYAEQCKLQAEYRASAERLTELQRRPKVCPTCGQAIKQNTAELNKVRETLEAELASKGIIVKACCEKAGKASQRLQEYRKVFATKSASYNETLGRKKQLEASLVTIQFDITRWEEIAAKQTAALDQLKQRVFWWREVVDELQTDCSFLENIIAILSRKGLPAYLTRMQLPRLSKAAAYYSQQFTEGVLQVQFYLDEDDTIATRILNPTGGQHLNGQSSGEGGLEALITSFALRDVGRCGNVLALDEPGDGLDAINARAFANGIRKIGHDLGTVFIITHSEAVASELTEARTLVLEKQDGVSRLVLNAKEHSA